MENFQSIVYESILITEAGGRAAFLQGAGNMLKNAWNATGGRVANSRVGQSIGNGMQNAWNATGGRVGNAVGNLRQSAISKLQNYGANKAQGAQSQINNANRTLKQAEGGMPISQSRIDQANATLANPSLQKQVARGEFLQNNAGRMVDTAGALATTTAAGLTAVPIYNAFSNNNQPADAANGAAPLQNQATQATQAMQGGGDPSLMQQGMNMAQQGMNAAGGMFQQGMNAAGGMFNNLGNSISQGAGALKDAMSENPLATAGAGILGGLGLGKILGGRR